MPKNLYQSLELLPDASSEDIVCAINHAKKYGKLNTKILNAAEEHLLDEEKRSLYDGYLVKVGESSRQFVPENKEVVPSVAPPKPKKIVKKESVVQDTEVKAVKPKPKPRSKPEKKPDLIPEVAKTSVQENIARVLEFPQAETPETSEVQKVETLPAIEFTPDETWKNVPAPTLCHECKQPLRARSLFCDQCGTKRGEEAALLQTPAPVAPPSPSLPSRAFNKKYTALLALFLGSFGAHKFYLGQLLQGVLYVLFFWTGIPLLLGIIEGVIFLNISEEDFDKKYNFE